MHSSNKDIENENFLAYKATGKLMPHSEEDHMPTLPKNRKKRLKKNQSSAINAQNLFFETQEKQIYNENFQIFSKEVIELKGKLSRADELVISHLCVAQIRLYRKTRMESKFNRFMDRVAPQDPMAQSMSCLKALGLLNEKSTKGEAKNQLSELLAKEANVTSSNGSELTKEIWEAEQEQIKVTLQEYKTDVTQTTYNDDFSDDLDDNFV